MRDSGKGRSPAAQFALIEELDYARYFLTIYDIVRFAENKGILCQGRGSAANSVICFMLGITNVDPEQIHVLFARFLSKERLEPPYIDVDFEHERREEVIQHIYGALWPPSRRYRRNRHLVPAAQRHSRGRQGIGPDRGRDVRACLDCCSCTNCRKAHVRQAGMMPTNPEIERAVDFANRLMGFPRHLSQHVGGFVLTRGWLDETVPIGNAAMDDRTFIEWDRDDIDVLGLMKVELRLLALGMLTCIRKAFDLMRHHGVGVHDIASVPPEISPRSGRLNVMMRCA